MSHHSTPHLHTNKTPGGLGADNGPSGTTSTNKGPMDSNTSISDSQASNAKQLLNAYVYDFLIKSRLPQTARIFVNEAEVPSVQNSSSSSNNNSPHQMATGNPQGASNVSTPHTASANSQQFQKENNLPCLALAMEAPQGFLFEWWLVFWDVMQAKNNKGGSQLATQYYQSQMLKQRQQQELQGLNIQPNMFGFANGQMQQMQQQQKSSMDQQQIPQQFNSQQQQLDPQQQQQRYMMQMMMKQQMSMGGNPVDPQQQQQMFGNMPPNNNLTLQQRMFITQQQQQQSQNRMQQHAQNQMNNLRQQAVAAQQHHPQHPPAPGQPNSQDISSHGSPSNVPRMNSQIAQAQHTQQPNGIQQFQQPQQPLMNGNEQPQAAFSQPQTQMGMRMNSNGKIAVPGNQGESMLVPNTNPSDNGAPTNRNMNALQDYQMQLMLLEKQNKKRLDIARNNGTADPNGLMAPNSGMMQPQAQLQQGNSQTQALNASPAAVINSPVVNNKPSPTTNNSTAASKRKKDAPLKRGRKSSATSIPAAKTPNVNSGATSATSNNPTNNNNGGTAFKKDYSAPLTPASESANDAISKRKRRNTSTAESPNKQTVTKNSASKEKPIPEEPSKDKKNEDVLPSTSSASFQDQPSDQIFSVEILGGNNNNDNHLFGAPINNGGLDDIDFDFNQFLDGSGDNSLNDGMNGFNWGSVDAIENGD